MNTRTTFILLAVLAAVGVVSIFVARRPEKDQTAKPQPRVLDVEASDIAKLIITPAEGQQLAFEREGSEWRILEPISAAARNVGDLTSALANLTPRGQVDASAENGLASPRYKVEVTTQSGKVLKLNVGNRQTVGDNLYVQKEGDPRATIVGTALYDHLEKPLAEYRETKLVSLPPADEIRQIVVSRPDGPTVELRKSGAEWQITKPQDMPAETSEVQSVTSAIENLRAEEFVSESDVFGPLNPNARPQTTVWFSTDAPATQPATRPATQPAGGVTIKVGGFDDVLKKNVYVSVSDPPTLAKVAASSVEAFKKKPLDLRDRKVLSIDPSLVSRVSITTEKPAATQPATRPASQEQLVIERRKSAPPVMGPVVPGTQPATAPSTSPATQEAATQPALPPTDWVMKGLREGDASQSQVEDLLAKFAPLRAQKYVEGPFPSTQPVQATYTIEITTEKAGTATQHVVRLQDPGEFKPLFGQHNGLTFEIDRFIADSLTADFANKPKPPEPPPMPPGGGGLPFGHP